MAPRTTSSVPDVKAALLTLLPAQSGLATVTMHYAWVGPQAAAEEILLATDPDAGTPDVVGRHDVPTLGGRVSRDERYSVPLTIRVFGPDKLPTGMAAVEARAFEILQGVENLLADNPNLDVGGVLSARAGDWSSTLAPMEGGWKCQLVFSIDIHARLN